MAASATGFYLSVDTLFNAASDKFLGSRTVGGLQPSATSSASTTVTVPAGTAPGVYFVIGVADYNGAVTESVESNNTRSASVRIGPDLIVPILNAPSSAVRGTSVSATDTVRNQGGDTAGASVTKYFSSTNGSIDAQDVLAATRSVPAIGAGLSHAGGVSLAIPPTLAAGTYCLIAQSDGNGAVAEAMETNNTRSRFITISAHRDIGRQALPTSPCSLEPARVEP